MVFDEGDGCQLFAELLQHNHPLQQSHVVDATGGKRQKGEEEVQTGANSENKSIKAIGSTYLMPSGSRPNNLFLTSSSLGVKSGMR